MEGLKGSRARVYEGTEVGLLLAYRSKCKCKLYIEFTFENRINRQLRTQLQYNEFFLTKSLFYMVGFSFSFCIEWQMLFIIILFIFSY